ncbi:hypothetical protein Ancab_031750 [Ancistrocladus abbreviatus]
MNLISWNCQGAGLAAKTPRQYWINSPSLVLIAITALKQRDSEVEYEYYGSLYQSNLNPSYGIPKLFMCDQATLTHLPKLKSDHCPLRVCCSP